VYHVRARTKRTPIHAPYTPYADKEAKELLKPNISDYVRGFDRDDLENEREYEEWAEAGKPETVEPVACPQGVCKARARRPAAMRDV